MRAEFGQDKESYILYFTWHSAILVLSIADYFFGGFYGKYFEVTGWN